MIDPYIVAIDSSTLLKARIYLAQIIYEKRYSIPRSGIDTDACKMGI
jgi:hypothetical protein